MKIWIEAALNGPWGRERQPGIPIRVDEIVAEGVAAAREGAAIIHVHAYDEETGQQRDDPDIYARIIEGIRQEVDAIVYPTIPLAGSGYASSAGAGAVDAAEARYAHLDTLARRGLVEWGVCDPGSVNFSTFAAIADGKPGFVYQNPEQHVRAGLAVCAEHRIRPSYAIYEPGFARAGAALAALHPRLPTPIYRLMLSDDFAWGFPPRPYALDAYRALLQEVAPGAPVMVAGLGVDLEPLMPEALGRGWHLRVGLEDARFGTDRTNRDLVRRCADIVRRTGHDPATAAEVRAGVS